MGTETPTNFPFCSAGPVLGTKLPKIIPMAIERNIHNAKYRSSHPRPLNMEALDLFDAVLVAWFSRSGFGELLLGRDSLASFEAWRSDMVMEEDTSHRRWAMSTTSLVGLLNIFNSKSRYLLTLHMLRIWILI